MRTLGAGILGLLLATSSASADVLVRYDVESRPLRRHAAPTDQLTFELFGDAACTVPVHQEALRLQQVEVLSSEIVRASQAQQQTARRSVARLHATLRPAVPRRGQYLRVRGPGIRPLGGACQPQDDGL